MSKKTKVKMLAPLSSASNKYELQVSVESGINADGVYISVLQNGKVIYRKGYLYGYDASYCRSTNPPYINDILQNYISKYNITKDNFNVVAGMNVFQDKKVSPNDVESFITDHCVDLIFNKDTLAEI